MTNALSSFGTFLKIGDGGGTEVFTTIAEVLDIKGPELELEVEDGTNHSSPNGWEEKVPTILKAGTVEFEIQFIPSNATHSYSAGLLKDMTNRTKRNFQMVFPGGSPTWAFSAYVAKFPPDAPVKGILKVPVTLEVTGQPTLA